MNQTLTLLKNVIFEVLQDMFFIFPEELDNTDELKELMNDKLHSFSIDIKGKDTYSLYFYFSENTGKEMASNYLGEEDDIIDNNLIIETLKEAVNVLGGNLLNHLSPDIHLGLPEYHKTSKVKSLLKSLNRSNTLLYLADEDPFIASIIY